MITKFVEVDFAQPLEPIYVDSHYNQLNILVRWGYLPLGIVRFPCQANACLFSAELLHREILQNFSWKLWELTVNGRLNAINDKSDLPAISVIVCTRDRAISLDRCLQKLAQLDYPIYEVIVVDNGSQDPVVAEIVKKHGFRYVCEETPGLDWARNRGCQEASYDIVAYIDDDALATPGWLRGIAYGFQDPQVMGLTGLVLPAELETDAQHTFEDYGGMSKGFSSFTIFKSRLNSRKLFWASSWGVGANMAFRRELFDQLGGFDVALDVGTPTNGGGDIEFFYRLVAAGYALRYEPAAVAYHVHRRDEETLKRQIYNNGRGFVAYLLTIIRNEPNKRFAVLYFALRWWFWEWLIKQTVRAFRRKDTKWALGLVLAELRGSLSALGAYYKSQKMVKAIKAKDLRDAVYQIG